MSYQARITKPPLMVTGRIGACGNTKRIPSGGSFICFTTGTKSLPSAPRPCSQITAWLGFGLVSISTAGSVSLIRSKRVSGFRAKRGLGTESLDHGLVGLDVRSADQVDAVRYRGEDAVHLVL